MLFFFLFYDFESHKNNLTASPLDSLDDGGNISSILQTTSEIIISNSNKTPQKSINNETLW